MAIPLESQEPDPKRKRAGAGKRNGPRPARGPRRRAPSGSRTDEQERSWADPPTAGAGRLDEFDRSLRARQRLALVLRLLGRLDGRRCLLLTPAVDESAFAFHLRAAGGCWTWATTRSEAATAMSDLLGEKVHVTSATATPFEQGTFDRVVVTEANQVLHGDERLEAELARVLSPGGLSVLTAPHHGRSFRLGGWPSRASRNGSTSSRNGSTAHAAQAEEIAPPSLGAGLYPVARGSCSRAFTRLVDRTPGLHGRPARLLAALDYLLPASDGFDVALSMMKPHGEAAASDEGGDVHSP